MKFNIKNTHNRIKYFYEFKAKHKDFTAVLPSKVKHIFDHELIQILPQRDPKGRRVILLHFGSKSQTYRRLSI